MSGEGSNWIQNEVDKRLKLYQQSKNVVAVSQQLNAVEFITFTKPDKSEGVTKSNIPVKTIPKGSVEKDGWGIRIGNTNQYIVDRDKVRPKSIDSSLLGLLLLGNTDASHSTELYIRRINDAEGQEYKVQNIPPEDDLLNYTFLVTGPFNRPALTWIGPQFSPSGRHLFLPRMASSTDPHGTLKFRILKNINLGLDKDGNRVVTCEEIIDKSFTLDYSYASQAPMVVAPSVPDVDLTTGVTIQYTSETDATTEWEVESDSTINTVFGSDVPVYDMGLVQNINPHLPSLYNYSALYGQIQNNCFYTFTEDSDGNPVVSYYAEYTAKRFSYKNFRVKSYSSTDTNNSGFFPYIGGSIMLPTEIGDPKKFKIASYDGRSGFTDVNGSDSAGNIIYSKGSGDGTPANATIDSLWTYRYLRNACDGRMGSVVVNNAIRIDSTNNIGIVCVNDQNNNWRILSGSSCLKVFNIYQHTTPPYSPSDVPTPLDLSYFTYADGSLTHLTENWSGYQRLYVWLKLSGIAPPGSLYLRLNAASGSPIDILIPHTISSDTEYKMCELDISGLGITTVADISLIYDDGSPPGSLSYAVYQMWIDTAMVLAKEIFNDPSYGSTFYEVLPPFQGGATPFDTNPRLFRNVNLGTAIFSESISVIYGNENDGTISTPFENDNPWRIYSGFLNSSATQFGGVVNSNSGGTEWRFSAQYCNANYQRGLMKISNLQSNSPSLDATLIPNDDALRPITVGPVLDQQSRLPITTTLTEPPNPSFIWPYYYYFAGAWTKKGTFEDSSAILRTNDSKYFYRSPFNSTTPIDKGTYNTSFGQYGPYITNSNTTSFLDFSSLVSPPDNIKAIDTDIFYTLEKDTSNPDNIKSVIKKLKFTSSLMKSTSISGNNYDSTKVLDWFIK